MSGCNGWRRGGYLPIADYGAIGNLRTVALVGRDGSIDWCCLPALNCPSVFGALLDARRGGRFRVAPARPIRSEQRYRGDSCVLETHFEADGGRLVLVDFMPLEGSIIGADDPRTAPDLYRLLRCTGGRAEVELEWCPRFGYAREPMRMERTREGFLAHAGHERMLLVGVGEGEGEIADDGYGPVLRARFVLAAGEHRALVARYAAVGVDHAPDRPDPELSLDGAMDLLGTTCAVWVNWAHDNERRPTSHWAGPWSSTVTRSELTLKMLTHPDSGSIAAAATTSLPESLGGVRNWDYRYCWVRDASFVVQALHALGHDAEAQAFINFVQRAVRQGGEQDGGMRIMYGLHGSIDLDERELNHLEGYRGSRPVRIGNAAAGQRQHDTYGELVDAVYELVRRGVQLESDDLPFVSDIVARACRTWREPDSGIWEVRGPEHHFVHSKVMAWVALDRGVRLSQRWGMKGEVERWRGERDHLRQLILRRGYNPDLGAFTQTFGSNVLDAAALRFPVHEFIEADHPMMRGTIDRVLERLTENGLVYRYRVDDGLPGEEGAFGLCTFWLVDALALAGRLDEAWEIFEGMMVRANHLGLYSEQIDPRSGEFLGNFPQAFTHIGVINSALYLAQAEGRQLPERAALLGSHAADGSESEVGPARTSR